MKKINIIKENEEYNKIIQNVKPFRSNYYNIFLDITDKDIYQFGFTISKKYCHAVMRNKIKRQIKDIVDKKNYKKGFKCIIMVKRNILNASYEEMKKDLFYCLDKIGIIEGDKNEK